MVLSSLAPAERTELLRGMSDEEAAICLAAMSLNTRTAVIADLAAADASLVSTLLCGSQIFFYHLDTSLTSHCRAVCLNSSLSCL